MRIALYPQPSDPNNDTPLGHTYLHVLPRAGESLVWHDKLYRVTDVVHPTEDEAGKGIHVPHVYVCEHPS